MTIDRILLEDVEITRALPRIELGSGDRSYAEGWLLVTIGGCPIGRVAVTDAVIGPEDLAERIWGSLESAITAHCAREGLSPPSRLLAGGLDPLRSAVATPAHLAQPFISVVICTRDRAAIAPALEAVLNQVYPEFELIVVDNAPRTDAVAGLINNKFRGRIRYLREDRPGASWARNRGLEEARGDIVVFTDDDAIADPGWLAALARGFTRGSRVGCVTGLCLPQELETAAQVLFQLRAEDGGFSQGFTPQLYDLGAHRPTDPLFPYRASFFGAGMNMAFRTQVLRQLGGFSTALGPGCIAPSGEDLAAYFEVIVSGNQLAYEPAAVVRHNHRADLETLERHMYAYGLGFTAYLSHVLLRRPSWLVGLLMRIPSALRAIGASRAAPGQGDARTQILARRERAGWIGGPGAYARSVLSDRQLRRSTLRVAKPIS